MASISEVNASMIPREDLKHLHMTGATPTIALQNDPRFCYSLYIPEAHYPPSQTYREGAKMPVVVVVHGGRVDHILPRNVWTPFAEQHDVAILVPLFPVGIDDPWNVDAYRFLGAAPRREYPSEKAHANGITKKTLYDRILLSMLDEASARWPGLQTDKFYLGGFSGGGQFSHRFLYLHPERLLGVCIGAPGFVTLADESQAWPNGVNGMAEIFDKEVDFDVIKKVPTLIVCGEEDTDKDTFVVRDRVHGAIPGLGLGSAGAGLRTENVGLLARSLPAKGVAVKLEYVPGVNHESVKVQPTMATFLAPLVEKKVAAK